MTAPDLRDQMAMAALTGLCADPNTAGEEPLRLAHTAYWLADAMLAERNRTTKGEDHV